MFTKNIRISEKTNKEILINSLTEQIEKSDINFNEKNIVIERTLQIIEDFFQHGIELSRRGSSMGTTSVVKGKGYNITINAHFGMKDSILDKILFWKN